MPALFPFHGRRFYADQFERLFRKPKASLVVVQGRRRIGKSAFVTHCGQTYADHFLKFEGLGPREDGGVAEQLAAFAEQLAAQTKLPRMTLETWPQALQILATALPTTGKVVLLLDEISWMAAGDKDFAGHLKIAWDNLFSTRQNLVVVLCGSVSSWIEENLLKSTGFVGRTSWVFTLPPMPLPECVPFWRGKAARISTLEKIKTLAVTGGVPRYLEEIDPAQTAEQNIHRLCFDAGGLLFREFEDLFSSVFNRRADRYRDICHALSGPAKTLTELSKQLKIGRGGIITEALTELESAGFITADLPFSPLGGTEKRIAKYRLSDNYTRFYLRYVAPEKKRIAGGLYRQRALETLPQWDSIMGLQFENLVLTNRDPLLRHIDLANTPILNAGPYFQGKTLRTEACQIDMLLRTKKSLYVIEIKLRDKIPPACITDVQEKIRRLKLPKGTPCRTVLVYHGELDASIPDEDYFDYLVPFERLFEA
ncbi:MAG TPA: ATPase [Verrucomicrobiales bacterium]|nr:ATPase [Verrucomicrobiales bacterium]